MLSPRASRVVAYLWRPAETAARSRHEQTRLGGGLQRNRAGLSVGVASAKVTLVGLELFWRLGRRERSLLRRDRVTRPRAESPRSTEIPPADVSSHVASHGCTFMRGREPLIGLLSDGPRRDRTATWDRTPPGVWLSRPTSGVPAQLRLFEPRLGAGCHRRRPSSFPHRAGSVLANRLAKHPSAIATVCVTSGAAQ